MKLAMTGATCPHCGTHEVAIQRVCHNSACSAYGNEETIVSDLAYPAVKLTRNTQGMCEVSLEIGGKWVVVVRDNGDFISHIVEPIGIRAAVANQKENS